MGTIDNGRFWEKLREGENGALASWLPLSFCFGEGPQHDGLLAARKTLKGPCVSRLTGPGLSYAAIYSTCRWMHKSRSGPLPAEALQSMQTHKMKVKEATRQGSIIAGGMIRGSLAGLAVSFVCGPAEPACAIAPVLIGSNLGGITAEAGNDLYQEELPVFMHWMND